MRPGSRKCGILYVVGQLGTGGLERQLYYLIRLLNRDWYDPAVVVWSYNAADPYVDRIRSLGVPVYGFPPTAPRYRKLTALRRLTRELRPHIVHSYNFYTNFAAWWCTYGTGTLSLGSIRNNFMLERREVGTVLGRLSSCYPRSQICNSLTAKTEVQRYFTAFKPARLHLVRNRIDLTAFGANSCLPDRQSLLAIGRLHPQKRWDRLISAVAMIKQRGVRVPVRLVGSGPLKEMLQIHAWRLGVEDLIQFMGVRHDIAELLADSTALIHTADYEGSPNVVMEAMACGRAVIATEAGDVPFLVDEGKTGFVVPRGDDGALVSRIIQLVTDKDLCIMMGKTGRRKAETEFGLEHLLSETVQAYAAEGGKH
jgi:glycosyltransferase involved in cell wall biosynthesis